MATRKGTPCGVTLRLKISAQECEALYTSQRCLPPKIQGKFNGKKGYDCLSRNSLLQTLHKILFVKFVLDSVCHNSILHLTPRQ